MFLRETRHKSVSIGKRLCSPPNGLITMIPFNTSFISCTTSWTRSSSDDTPRKPTSKKTKVDFKEYKEGQFGTVGTFQRNNRWKHNDSPGLGTPKMFVTKCSEHTDVVHWISNITPWPTELNWNIFFCWNWRKSIVFTYQFDFSK